MDSTEPGGYKITKTMPVISQTTKPQPHRNLIAQANLTGCIMSITESCRKVTISKGILTAECRKSDQKTYISASISLDDHLGVVDGKLVWGSKGFSQLTQDVAVVDGILTAKLKTTGNKLIDGKFDLSHYIHNNNGVLEPVQRPRSVIASSPRKTDTVKAAPGLLRTTSLASAASAATDISSATSNLFSATSSTSSATSVLSSSSTTSKSSFSSTAFRR
ncbi:hypothetical protein GALMADRAFT_810660 [Galerina marginata CBS 339.88]|uniref:Cyanovirin-N domain-containing protein n=1 Tax=Galerina marginata (strain CBS 339.88) TaxID=685588 RepID=A0A067SIS6_GALM3|nr:hypothetical protein GALMADRAFT_810660 [Galerina marginata CBS 339.88]